MNDGLKTLGIIAGGAVMIACCVALSVGSVVVLGAIGGLWAWLGGLDPALSAGVALVVAVLAYWLIRGRKRGAGAYEKGAPNAPAKSDRA